MKSREDVYELGVAARVGRHIVAWSIFALSSLWTIQLYRGGGTSGLLACVHDTLGDYATGAAGVVSIVLLAALFRREAKIVGGLAFSAFAGVTGLVGGMRGYPDTSLMFLFAIVPLGFAAALMAKAGGCR